MKVVLLTQVLPYPPDSGPKVKTLYVLKYLAQYHDVTLVSFVRGDQSEHVHALSPYCKAIYTVPMKRSMPQNITALLKSLVGNVPWMMARDDVKEMRELVSRVSMKEKFDVVHADQLNMAQYALPLHGTRRVLDAHNALWVLYRRLALTMKHGVKRLMLERDWRLLKGYEGRVCRDFDKVIAVSEEDKAALEEALSGVQKDGSISPKKEVYVIPIAVDTDELKPVKRISGASHIIHIGTMFWPPNIDGIMWFLENVFPLVHMQRPDVVFDIIGARPPEELLDYASSHSQVNVLGYVNDPNPYLEQAALMVVPLRAGGGMRVKILNALAQELPVVSTTLGAEGIRVVNERDLLIADSPQNFAEATLRLLNDPDLAIRLGANGRKLIQEQYDYRTVCAVIEKVYQA